MGTFTYFITVFTALDNANNAHLAVGDQVAVDSSVGQGIATIASLSPIPAIYANATAADITVNKMVIEYQTTGATPQPGDLIAVFGNVVGLVGGIAALVPGGQLVGEGAIYVGDAINVVGVLSDSGSLYQTAANLVTASYNAYTGSDLPTLPKQPDQQQFAVPLVDSAGYLAGYQLMSPTNTTDDGNVTTYTFDNGTTLQRTDETPGTTHVVITDYENVFTIPLPDGQLAKLGQSTQSGELIFNSTDQNTGESIHQNIITGTSASTTTETLQNVNDAGQVFSSQTNIIDDGMIAERIINNSNGTSQIATNNVDGTTITGKYSGVNGSGSLLSQDSEYPDGSSQITTFNLNGPSISNMYTGPHGTGTLTQTDQENPNGTSQITNYNPSGSSVSSSYTGPNGTGAVTAQDIENSDSTSRLTTYNLDGSSIFAIYSGPHGTGTLTQTDQENNDGTSEITTYTPGGSSVSSSYSGPGGTGNLTEQFVQNADGSSTDIVYNTDGSYLASSYDSDGNLITDLQYDTDGSYVRTYYDPTTGEALGQNTFTPDTGLFSFAVNGSLTANQFATTVADAAADQLISTFLLKNNVPASLIAETFANASVKDLSDTLLSSSSTVPTFSADLAGSLTNVVTGYLGGQLGGDISSVLGSLGLPPQLASIAGNVFGNAAVQTLTSYISTDLLKVTLPGLTTNGSLSIANFNTSLGTSFETAGLTLAGQELVNLIIPSNGIVSNILSSIGATIGSILFEDPIGAFIGSALGDLLGDIGDLFGYRGRPFSEAAVGLSGGQLALLGVYVDNGGDPSVGTQMGDAVVSIDNTALASIGGTVTNLVNWDLGSYKDNFFSMPASAGWPPPSQYNGYDSETAVELAAFNILKSAQFSGANPYMLYTLEESPATTLQALLGDLSAVSDYSNYITNPLAFNTGLALTGDSTQLQSWTAELADAQTLGLTTFTVSGSVLTIQTSPAEMASMLAKFTGLFGATYTLALAVSAVPAANAVADATSSNVASIAVSDSTNNILNNIAALESVSREISAINLTDGGTPLLATGEANFLNNLAVFNLVLSPHTVEVFGVAAGDVGNIVNQPNVTSITAYGTASQIAANLAAIEAAETKGLISSIDVDDAGNNQAPIHLSPHLTEMIDLAGIGAVSQITVVENTATITAANRTVTLVLDPSQTQPKEILQTTTDGSGGADLIALGGVAAAGTGSSFFAGDGTDATLTFNGPRSKYVIANSGANVVVSSNGVVDTLNGIAFLQFTDQRVSLLPTSPSASALTLDAASDSGGPGLTDATNLIIDGQGEAGDTVTVDDGTTAVGTGIVAQNGAWSVTTRSLSDGIHKLTASESRIGAVVGASSSPLSVMIDTQAPFLSSPTVTVQAGGAPIAIGITATDPEGLPLKATVTGLPAIGEVTTAGSTTAVAVGETLTAAQLQGLAFVPLSTESRQGLELTYSVVDSAGNTATGAATLNTFSLSSAVMTQSPATGQLDFLEFNQTNLSESFLTPYSVWPIVAAGDFNNDGLQDLISQSTGEIDFLYMGGSGQLAGSYLANGTYWPVVGADTFNGFGSSPAILTQDPNSGELDLLGFSSGLLTSSELLNGSYWPVVGVGDFNGNGTTEIATQDKASGQIDLLMFNGAQLTGSNLLPGAYWPVNAADDFHGTTDLVAQSADGQIDHLIFNGNQLTGSYLLSNPVPGLDVVDGTGVVNHLFAL